MGRPVDLFCDRQTSICACHYGPHWSTDGAFPDKRDGFAGRPDGTAFPGDLKGQVAFAKAAACNRISRGNDWSVLVVRFASLR